MTTSIRKNSPQFNVSELPITLGSGGYANVCLGAINGVALCAIKKNEKWPSFGYREASILSSLKHPYIVRYFGQFPDKAECKVHRLITEYCPSNVVQWTARGVFSKTHYFSKFFRQLSIAVAYLHEKNILHLDIKPNNILIDRFGEIKLADFGTAKIGTTTFISQDQQFGSAQYRAPESLFHKQYGTKSDLFGVGITVLTAKCQIPPIFENDEENQKLKVKTAIETNTFEKIFSISGEIFSSENSSEEKIIKKLKLLVDKCLALNPKNRLNATQLTLNIAASLEDRVVTISDKSKKINIKN